jgi:hypothetical protein
MAFVVTGCSKPGQDGAWKESLVHLKFEENLSSAYSEVIANYQKLDSAWPEAKLLECGLTDCGKPLHLYVITCLLAQHNSMPEPVGNFFSETMIPALYAMMRTTTYEMIPYAEWDVASPEKGMANYVQTPRFSTGYVSCFMPCRR